MTADYKTIWTLHYELSTSRWQCGTPCELSPAAGNVVWFPPLSRLFSLWGIYVNNIFTRESWIVICEDEGVTMLSALQACPRHLLVCEQSSFLREKSRHSTHVETHYFNYCVSTSCTAATARPWLLTISCCTAGYMVLNVWLMRHNAWHLAHDCYMHKRHSSANQDPCFVSLMQFRRWKLKSDWLLWAQGRGLTVCM